MSQQQAVSEPLVSEFQKNATARLRIQPTRFHGYDLVDIREYYEGLQEGEWKPSPKGISFRRHLLPKVIEALKRIQAAEEGEEGLA